MLQAYIDDSGTHLDSPYCLVAGYWGGTSQWVKFEREWGKVLRDYDVPEFHAKKYWAKDDKHERVGSYRGWDEKRHKQFLFRLLTIIGAHKLYPFAHGIQREEWNKQADWQRRAFCGGSVDNAPDNPMFMALQTSVMRIIRHCHPGVPMHFVFDSNQHTDKWAAICYGQIKAVCIAAKDPLARNLGEITFADSALALPLQAADLLAYEAYQYAKWAKGDRNAKTRPSYMLALRNFRSKDDFWLFDADRFEITKRAIDTIRKRWSTLDHD